MNTRRAVDAIWLLALSAYIFGGMTLASFHGDEAMHITTSRDYFTAFVDGQPENLLVTPPYISFDADNALRLLNGSINRYAIGLSLRLTGYDESALPGLWEWPLSYEDNLARGHRPTEALLNISRLSSTLFLALSAAIMFGIGWQFGGRPLGYLVSALYVLNPIILLNGRRAMMEGSLLCFGLLAIWLAILISRGRSGWRWWLALAVSSGLAIASKHSGLVFVGGAFGWVFLASTLKRDNVMSLQTNLITMRKVIIQAVLAFMLSLLIFVALSPSLWSDPVARLGDLVFERQELLQSQVVGLPDGPMSLSQRVSSMVTQPFMTPVVHFEAGFWASAAPIMAEIERYMASPLSGWQFGVAGGLLLTLLAGVGLAVVLRQWRSWQVGLLAWLAVTVASLLVNPLPWQRYYLPLIPVMTLLAAYGLSRLVGWLRQRARSSV